ncbi:MAG: exodeoxyribonuclease III [Pseudomonadota bacterium]
MKVATWNVNSLRVRLPQVIEWSAAAQPDIIGLQETKTEDPNYPVDALREAGYESVFAGQKTYNGVALLAKTNTVDTARDVVTDLPGLDDPQRRVMVATYGDLRVVNLYVPNGKAVGSDKYAYKLDWLAHLRDFLAAELEQHERVVVMGDFNIAPEDRDVHDPAEWEGAILCSEPERDALAALTGLGLSDAFREFDQPDKAFSWWDYRAAGFRRNRGLRIDLVLVSDALRSTLTECRIDVEPRTWERPSDHTPVVATFK